MYESWHFEKKNAFNFPLHGGYKVATGAVRFLNLVMT